MTVGSRRFLFTMWEGGGTIPPELGVARQLVERGHTVHVLADPTIEAAARAAGCEFSSWRRAPHSTELDPDMDPVKDWEVKNPLTLLRRVRDGFLTAPAAAYAADTREAIDDVRPDVLIPDFMLFGTMIPAQASGLPVAPIVPNIWMIPTKGLPVIGPGFMPATNVIARARNRAMFAVATRIFDGGLPEYNAVRADYGLRPLRSIWDQVRNAHRVIVLASPTFDFAAPHLPGHVRYVGPILDDPVWAEPWSPPTTDDATPLVVVALSSTFQDQAATLHRIVDALAELPVRAIVTLGQMLDEKTLDAPPNVTVLRSAPHSALIPRAAAVITHCGHGTTMKALAAGVPLVCLPMGRDQNDNAARVVYQGAGVRLSPSASSRRIAEAITAVLRDGRYREGAQRMASVLKRELAQNDVVSEFESIPLAARRQMVAETA